MNFSARLKPHINPLDQLIEAGNFVDLSTTDESVHTLRSDATGLTLFAGKHAVASRPYRYVLSYESEDDLGQPVEWVLLKTNSEDDLLVFWDTLAVHVRHLESYRDSDSPITLDDVAHYFSPDRQALTLATLNVSEDTELHDMYPGFIHAVHSKIDSDAINEHKATPVVTPKACKPNDFIEAKSA